MAQVTVEYGERTMMIPAQAGESLLSVLTRARIAIAAPCGGRGSCGKCRVRAGGRLSEMEASEKELLAGAEDGIRLACRARVEGDAYVRLEAAAADEFGCLRPVTPNEAIGLAVDIGTTTIEARFYSLDTGELLAQRCALNAQRAFGADVISRISAASEHLPELQAAAAETIGEMIGQFCVQSGASREQFARVTAAGNTAMLHLLCGRSPASLGTAPFLPDTLFGECLPAERCGLPLPMAQVYPVRCISGFVGGDLTACAAAVGLDRAEQACLLIDVGTNGEMALAVNGRSYVCSVAAGPALEGGRISCGMGGVPGAVRRVRLEDGAPVLETVGNTAPVGICGSGLIDAAAVLLSCGAMDETGRLDGEALPQGLRLRLTEREGEPAFRLDESGKITLTQRDIREIQLAKAAFAAGIELLLQEAGGIQPTEILLAGSMGSALDVQSAKRIGMLPACCDGASIRTVGNGALEGASLALIDEKMPARFAAIAKQAKVIELAGRPEFNDRFIESMLFPAQ